jgi:hypothetical protein
MGKIQGDQCLIGILPQFNQINVDKKRKKIAASLKMGNISLESLIFPLQSKLATTQNKVKLTQFLKVALTLKLSKYPTKRWPLKS